MIPLPGPNFEELKCRSNKIDEVIESFIQSLNTRPDGLGSIFKAVPTVESTLLQILNGDYKLYYVLRLRGGEMISQDFVNDMDKMIGNIGH